VRSSSAVSGDALEVVEIGAECAQVHGIQADKETDFALED
jgi:hypothetical protein